MEWAKTVGDVIRADLDGADKAVLLAILGHTDPDSGQCFANFEQLIVAASCSESTVQRALRRLDPVLSRVPIRQRGNVRGSPSLALVYDHALLPHLIQQTRATREAKAAFPKPKVPKGKLKAYQELVELCPEPGCPLKAHVANLEAQQEEVSHETVSDMLF